MPLKKRETKHEGAKPQLQTVQDVEVKQSGNPTPTSPPATEEDRANFQKLLLQIHGVDISSKSKSLKMRDSDTAKNITVINSGSPKVNQRETKDLSLIKLDSVSKADVPNCTNQSQHDTKNQGDKKKRVKNKKPLREGPDAFPQSAESHLSEKIPHNSKVHSLKDKGNEKHPRASNASSLSVTKAVVLPNDAQKNVNLSKKSGKQCAEMEKSSAAQVTSSQRSDTSKAKKQFDKPQSSDCGVGERLPKPHESSPAHYRSEEKYRRDFDIIKGLQVAPARNGPKMKGSVQQTPIAEANQPMLVFDFDPSTLLVANLNRILPQKKNPTSFHCFPCDKIFVDIKRHFEKHKESHMFKWKLDIRSYTVEFLPQLSPEHFSLLDDMVGSVAKQYGMTDVNYELASDAWNRLETLASTNFPGCTVRWFGSHSSNIALMDNDLLNMDLYVPNKEEAASTFLKFISIIEKDSSFGNVDRVIATNFAHANIVDKNSSYAIQLSLNNTGAHHTAKLIQEYVALDPRVRPLCIFFRAWGKLCGIDRGEDGSWQGHAFPIMVIHFLQQKEVLPVLHDFIDTPERSPEIYPCGADVNGKWACRNRASVGRLLFEMLRYYAVEHNVENHIVCITQFKPYLRSDTKWTAKRIAVIDPFQPKHNISRFITANMYEYVHFCLLTTVCALGIPRTVAGPLYGYIIPPLESFMFQKCPEVPDQFYEISELLFQLVMREDDSFDVGSLRDNNEQMVPQLWAMLQSSPVFKVLEQIKFTPKIRKSPVKTEHVVNAYADWIITPHQATNITKNFRKDLLKYSFNKSLFTENEEPPMSCSSCHRHGHIKATCPDEIIPKMKPLPPPSSQHLGILDQLCQQVFDNWSSGPDEHRYRREVREDLLSWLQQFYSDIDLHLFGSSCNGFGGKSSDIDMCLTFKSNDTGLGLNFPSLVEEITLKLRGHKNVYRLLPITTAKVPIVKFEYGRNHIQVDMSLYNLLGIKNTQLLHTYSTIDRRVRPLVYMMKRLAKTTSIGDASRGSLSSYAYSLMTLYFLQQTNPPIIPVLQELSDPGSKPVTELIESANVYFYKNMETLDEVWPYRNKNKSTIGELWLQLLEFYASDDFHRAQKVVCIRKQEPLYKFDKLWTSTNLCIEDPFDLNHNLGSGLTKRMNIFIVKTFQKALKHFSFIQKQELLKGNVEAYFFHEGFLSVGKPPSDRGCHFCHCLGHVQSDCPKRNLNRGNMGGKRGNDIPGNRMNAPNRMNMNSPRGNFNFDNFSRRENQRVPNHPMPVRTNVSHHQMPLNQVPVNQVAASQVGQKQMLSNQMHPGSMLPNQLPQNPLSSNHMPSNQIAPNQLHGIPLMNHNPHGHQPLPTQNHPLLLPVRPPPGFPLVASGPPGRPMVRIMGPPMMPGIPLQALPPQSNVWR